MRNSLSRSNLFKFIYIALLVTVVVMSSPFVECPSCSSINTIDFLGISDIDWVRIYALGKT